MDVYDVDKNIIGSHNHETKFLPIRRCVYVATSHLP